MNLSDYRGKVSKCRNCTNSDPLQPMGCPDCFSRGYTAECLHCMGTGQTEEGVAGGNGKMKVTCAICGGKGNFAVNKPDDWGILHPAEVETESLEAVA